MLLWALASLQAACGIELRTITVADGAFADTALNDAPSPDLPETTADAGDVVADVSPPSDLVSGLDVPPTMDGGCAPPAVACGSACAVLATDDSHCGACGNRCSTDETCTAGTCLAAGPTRSTAGAACTHPTMMGGMDSACGTGMVCVFTDSTPVCTIDCVDSPTQLAERGMCGGVGATCLALGDGPTAESLCVQACSPGAAPGARGACRAGFVCTGWWYSHANGSADRAGCVAFCSRDSDCPSGMACNVRRGRCGGRAVDPTRLPDGSPCDPTVIELVPEESVRRNVQCRGQCLPSSDTERTHGVCGSSIDLAVTQRCPDDPSAVQPMSDPGRDNLALCVSRTCTVNRECSAPHVCRYDEDAMGRPVRTGPTTCDYPTAAQPTGIP